MDARVGRSEPVSAGVMRESLGPEMVEMTLAKALGGVSFLLLLIW